MAIGAVRSILALTTGIAALVAAPALVPHVATSALQALAETFAMTAPFAIVLFIMPLGREAANGRKGLERPLWLWPRFAAVLLFGLALIETVIIVPTVTAMRLRIAPLEAIGRFMQVGTALAWATREPSLLGGGPFSRPSMRRLAQSRLFRAAVTDQAFGMKMTPDEIAKLVQVFCYVGVSISTGRNQPGAKMLQPKPSAGGQRVKSPSVASSQTVLFVTREISNHRGGTIRLVVFRDAKIEPVRTGDWGAFREHYNHVASRAGLKPIPAHPWSAFWKR